MNAIAIIPARGGSKRIPRKNIRPFMGKPIIAYSISAAQQADLFDEIVVSTDDGEIAEVAKHYGASVPFMRPAEISDDQTGLREVVVHAISELQKQGKSPTMACVIYAAAPLIRHLDIIGAYEKLQTEDKDFVVAATVFPATIFRAFDMRPDGTIEMFWPENYPINSQDFPEAYHDAGQFFWGRQKSFLEKSSQLFSRRTSAFLIPRYRAIDIDTLEDWHFAELLYKALRMTDNNVSA